MKVDKVVQKQWKRRLKSQNVMKSLTKKTFTFYSASTARETLFLMFVYFLVSSIHTVTANPNNNKCGDIKIGDLVV